MSNLEFKKPDRRGSISYFSGSDDFWIIPPA